MMSRFSKNLLLPPPLPLLPPLLTRTRVFSLCMALTVLAHLGTFAMPTPGHHRAVRHNHNQHHQRWPSGSHRLELEQSRVDAIKQDLLRKIGLERVPDVSKFNVSTEELRQKLKLYRDSLEDTHGKTHTLFDDDQYMAKDFHEIKFSECPSDGCTVSSHPGSFHVDLFTHVEEPKAANRETLVHSAKLKLYKTAVKPQNIRDRSISGNAVRISVYLIVRGDSEGNGFRRLIDSKMVSLEESEEEGLRWESFDVTAALQQWHADPNANFGLDLICDTQPIHELIEFQPPARASSQNLQLSHQQHSYLVSDFSPLLQYYTQTRLIVADRRKRATSTLDCEQGTGETLCCRYPLWVSFADIGWQDWVLAPEGYQAYYCNGSCPHSFKVAHNFAAVKSILYHANPAAAPAPCCSASKLSPLSIVHFNEEGDLTVTQYEDMVVEQCKCS